MLFKAVKMSGPETTTTAALNEFAQWLADPEESVLSILGDDKNEGKLPTALLQTVCQQLFSKLEDLGQRTGKTFSGLDSLYTGDGTVDAETIWGQIELQNASLLKLTLKAIKDLEKSKPSEVRLIDTVDDTEEELDNGGDSKSESSESETAGDDETDRIQQRMARAEADVMSDEDEETGEQRTKNDEGSIADSKEFELDRDAVDMHDGFFNFQSMEEFADEEEAYLPDQAFGEEKPDVKEKPADKRSFHQRQRDGDAEVERTDSEDDEEDDLLFRKPNTRRKKYREDDEIDALDNMYKPTSDDDDDAIHMTAADYFGKPNQRYYERYKSKHSNDAVLEDFEQSQEQGWNDEQREGASDEEEREDERSEEDERVPMNDAQKYALPPTKQAARVLSQTEELEKELLEEKPWQMRGETGGTARPVNSLLESTPEFEVANKIAPAITVEHTENLEDVIKKRILAEDWDDVVPRELPDVGWNLKRGETPEVSQEKSKLGLGELYEREYLKKAVGYDVEGAEKETEEEKAKTEMRSLFANLCSKLDALSNYHFAPRPVAAEASVRAVSQPAIAMEEVLPLHVSDARAVAPEELYGTKRGREGILRADSELDQQERKRRRSAKKTARRKARRAKLADEKLVSRLQPGLGLNNPYEKRKIRQELAMARSSGKITAGDADTNNYGDSGTFFKRMQQEAEQSIQGSKQRSKAVPEEKSKKSSIYKL